MQTREIRNFGNHDMPMTKIDSHDPRIIPRGEMLRALGLDKLSQVFNMLRGDMGMVGPQACMLCETDEHRRWHRNRFSIFPRLPGLRKVGGKDDLTFRQPIQIAIQYWQSASLLSNMTPILLTSFAVGETAIGRGGTEDES